MNNLIHHLWKNNKAQVLSSSYLDCHVRGLHSIMLLDQPGARIRLFVAAAGHEMWKNNPRDLKTPFSIGYHQHRTDLVIEGVAGCFINHVMQPESSWDTGLEMDRYTYSSQIVDGKIGFKKTGRERLYAMAPSYYKVGESVALAASKYHTVEVPRHWDAAWLVYEGKAWDGYVPQTFTNADLENFDGDGMYTKASEEQIDEILTQVLK